MATEMKCLKIMLKNMDLNLSSNQQKMILKNNCPKLRIFKPGCRCFDHSVTDAEAVAPAVDIAHEEGVQVQPMTDL